MASRSLNRVLLIGNLTRDPELKYTPAGTAVCSFGIATNRTWTTADGQTKEDTQFHRIVAWQKLAELCAKLLTKGRKVFLEGRITYRSFIGKDGQQKTLTEIVLDDFIVFYDGRKLASAAEQISESQKERKDASDEKEQIDKKDSKKQKEESKSDSKDVPETVDIDDIPF